MDRHISKDIISVMLDWFTRCFVCIRWCGSYSYWFPILAGVRQGGILSPVICCLYGCSYLARSAKLPEGLYILPMIFLYFFTFFSGRPRSHAGSKANGPIFTKISGLVDN